MPSHHDPVQSASLALSPASLSRYRSFLVTGPSSSALAQVSPAQPPNRFHGTEKSVLLTPALPVHSQLYILSTNGGGDLNQAVGGMHEFLAQPPHTETIKKDKITSFCLCSR